MKVEDGEVEVRGGGKYFSSILAVQTSHVVSSSAVIVGINYLSPLPLTSMGNCDEIRPNPFFISSIFSRHGGYHVRILRDNRNGILHNTDRVGGGPVRRDMLPHRRHEEILAPLLLPLPHDLLRVPLQIQRPVLRPRPHHNVVIYAGTETTVY